MNTCDQCRYYNRMSGANGQCRRYPPTIVVLTNANGETDFINERPFVAKTDTCGEFMPPVQ